jgi:hypothetical protein
MAGFSVSQAIGSGFRLIAREPRAVFVWWLAYLVFAAVMYGVMLLAAPELFAQYLELGRHAGEASPEQLSAIASSAGKLMVFLPLLLIAALAFAAVFVGAIYRGVLEPEERRMAYIRFGRQELSLGLSLLVWVVLSMAVYVATVLVASLAGGLLGVAVVAAGGGKVAVVLVTCVCILVAVLFTLWVSMRLGLALPISFAEARFVGFGGWQASKGQGGKMMLMALGLILLLIVLEAAILVAFLLVAGMVGSGLETALQAGQLGALLPFIIVWSLVMSVLGVAFYVILAAPLADIYRQLRDQGALSA